MYDDLYALSIRVYTFSITLYNWIFIPGSTVITEEIHKSGKLLRKGAELNYGTVVFQFR